MQFNDFISDRILCIVFDSKKESILIQYLSGLDYDVNFMISNPITIDNVRDIIGINRMRDQKLDYLLQNKEMKRELLVIDTGMISKYKGSHYDLIKELVLDIRNNNRSQTPVILLFRGYTNREGVDLSISNIRTPIIADVESVLSFNGEEFNIIKSREYSNGNFKINTGV